MRFSLEIYSLMNMMHYQISWAISTATSDTAIPEIQNRMGSLSSGQRELSLKLSQDISEKANKKLTMKDSRFAFELRDTGISSAR